MFSVDPPGRVYPLPSSIEDEIGAIALITHGERLTREIGSRVENRRSDGSLPVGN